jgi:hypothetical protein
MRNRLIITIDGKPTGQPVLFCTDTEFKKLRAKLLRKGYPMDFDRDKNALSLFTDGMAESDVNTMPERIQEILNIIRPIKRRKTL